MECIGQNATPLFEWCDVGPTVGVLCHSAQRLVLLAIRDNRTGAFWSFDAVATLAHEFDLSDVLQPVEGCLDAILSRRSLIGEEGVVVFWPASQYFVKIKTVWYNAIITARRKKQSLASFVLSVCSATKTLRGLPDSTLWKAVFSWTDDEKAAIYTELPSHEQHHLRAFDTDISAGIDQLDRALYQWAEHDDQDWNSSILGEAGG